MDFKVLSTLYDSDIIISVKTMLYGIVNHNYGTMARPKKSEHYVNNKEFLNALENYFAEVERAKLNDQPKPQIPRYIGECFLKTQIIYHINPTL